MVSYFSRFGKVKNTEILKDKNTGKSRCFGFIEFYDTAAVAQVMNSVHTINNKRIECKYALPSNMAPPSKRKQRREWNPCRIFVGGISQAISERALMKYFQKFGPVEDCVILKHEGTKKYRGFAFVTYQDYPSTEKLFMNGRFHFIKGKKVDCKYAFPKKDRFDGLDELRKKRMEDAVNIVQLKVRSKNYVESFPRLGSELLNNKLANDQEEKLQKKNLVKDEIVEEFSSEVALRKIVSLLDEDQAETEPSVLEDADRVIYGFESEEEETNQKKSANFLLSNIFSKSEDEITEVRSPISKKTDLRCANSAVFELNTSSITSTRDPYKSFNFDEPIQRAFTTSSLSEKVSPSKGKEDHRERLGSINLLNDSNCLRALEKKYHKRMRQLVEVVISKENIELKSKCCTKKGLNYLLQLKNTNDHTRGGFRLFG